MMDVQRSKATRKIWPQVDALKLAMNWSERDLDKMQILVDDVYRVKAIRAATIWEP